MRSAWRIGVVAAVLTGAVVAAGGPVASARPDSTVGVAEVAGAALVPVAPARLLDTRTGVGGALGPAADGAEVALQVAGRAGIPGDAVAVALTVTATEPTAPGYVTVWPTGMERPLASNLNVERAGQTIADGVVVPLGTGGQVSLLAQSATHMVVDVTAYWRAAATTDGGRFTPVPPARVLDTRTGVGAPLGSLGDDSTIELALAGRGGLPAAGIRAVALTLTATGTTGAGFATARPGGPRPRVSALNVDTAGEDVAATVIVPVSATGSVSLYVQTASHLVADVTGWFGAEGAGTGQAGLFVPAAPTRLLDTRLDGSGGMAPGSERVLLLSGAAAPGAIAAVVGTLTATEATGPGYVAVAPTGSAGASTSSLNISRAGQTIANLVLAPVSVGGEVTLLHEAGGHLLLDVSGWFLADVPVAPDEGPGGTDPSVPSTAPSNSSTTSGGGSSSSSSTSSTSSTTSTTRPPSSTTSSVPVPPGDLSLSPWQVKANAPTVRSEGGAATVDGRIYVMGGYIDSFTPTLRVDVYDAAADSWSRGPNLPSGVSHVAVAVIGTDVYLAGGYPVKPSGTGQDFATAAVWRFDTVGRRFLPMPDLPQARGSGALVALDGELHFISGVSTGRADRTEHWVLDPRDANPTWMARAPIPVGRSHLGYIAYQGRIWAIGGHQKWDENAVYLNRVDVYDPATDRWTAGPALPGPRGHIGGAVELVAGRIVVMGGDDAFKEAKPNVWAYDPRDGRWEDLVELPLPRYAGFGGVVGNRLYYASGDIPRYNRTYCAIVSS